MKKLFVISNMKLDMKQGVAPFSLCYISLFTFTFSLFTFLCHAQYNQLLDFNFTNGNSPRGDLTVSGDLLYGMTSEGGADSVGCIFSFNRVTQVYTGLHNFTGLYNGGWGGALVLSGNKLYGMSIWDGAYTWGYVFSMNADGSGFTDLHDFNDTAGGAPYGGLTLAGGRLYGMTYEGGNLNGGVIFSIDTNGNGYKILYSFNNAGCYPQGSLLMYGNKLYGMTSNCGTYGYGNIFCMDTNGNEFKILLEFDGTNGRNSGGTLLCEGNKLYGMTINGGSNSEGCVFSIDTNGTDDKILVSFNGTNGANPYYGKLTLSGSALYGMTAGGGASAAGVIFSIDTDGSLFKNLFNFNDTSGRAPYGSVILLDNLLYGMISEGGTNGYGVLFSYNLAETGINQSSVVNSQWSVYPNPSNGIFAITLSHAELVSASQPIIEIYNALGQQVYTSTLPPPNGGGVSFAFPINISSQPDGIYLYRVIANSGELMGEGKLVIQK